MVSFLAVFLIAFIKQLVVYVVFATCNSYGGDIVVIIPTILLIGYLILYFTSTDTICKLIKIDKKKYDTYGCISWILSAILQFILSDIDFIWKALPKSGALLSGIEYILVPFFLAVYLAVLGIIKLIIRITKKSNKK